MQKYNVFSPSIILTSGHATYNYLLPYSQTWGVWIFEGNRRVRTLGGRWGIFSLDVKGVSSLPTCQGKSQMKNAPGSWKSPAKAPVPCSVPLAGAWSNHSPVRTVGAAQFSLRGTQTVAVPSRGAAPRAPLHSPAEG